jgi:putative endonuclease
MAVTDLMNANDTTSESSKVIGQRAENLAAAFLENRGFAIVARNFRCRGGEIDLVCRDGKSLVFVEVRLRRNANYGGAGASITANKQRRIILAAQHYLAAHAHADCPCRFDCVLLDGSKEESIEWVRDAFSAS